MKKINSDGIRALIIETLEEISLGEAKKVKEAEEPVVDPGDETAAAARGAREQDFSGQEVDAMTQNVNINGFEQLLDSNIETVKLLLKVPTRSNVGAAKSSLEDLVKFLKERLPKQTPSV